ncbi:hypothetical protein [Streptomyces sp. NBC_00344]|uniref:hypothetical protein n=1 Tax=Streptomyces sp. NBC_00344 TaxID=2975720 RepID=UPI002E1BF684
MTDQQYPYGRYDQYGQQQPQPPYQEPYAQDPHAHDPYTQTWDGQTWDTQYQPVQQSAQHPRQAGGHQQQAAGHPQEQHAQQYPPPQEPGGYPPQHSQQSQPQQPFASGHPQQSQQSQPQQPFASGHPQQYPQSQQPQQYPQQPVAADPAYLPPQSHPLPPETPAAAPAAAPAAGYESPAAEGPAYSAPSTAGNARITDAQRARAEGRSPIIAPGMQPAGLTAGLALLIALTAFGGRYAVLVPLLVLQALTAAGWFRLNGMWPARQGIALAFAGGVVADAALLVAGAGHGPAAIIGTLGVWVLLTLVLQLRSHAPGDERMAGLLATIASSALAVMATGTLAASMDAVTVGGIAVAVAVIARALPLPGPASVLVALLAGAGAGIAAGGMTGLGAQGALLGFAAGGCALIGLRVASYDYPSRFVHMTAGVALPLTAAAPAIYLIGRVVG